MRRRRIIAKARTIARDFLDANVGATETCQLLHPYTSWVRELFSEEDKKFLDEVSRRANGLPIGRIVEEWHPDYLQVKLEAIAKNDDAIRAEVKKLCDQILERSDQMRSEAKQELSLSKEG
jgi:hypothetical protein